jgi:F-type H+-transporting ATPase subunit b
MRKHALSLLFGLAFGVFVTLGAPTAVYAEGGATKVAPASAAVQNAAEQQQSEDVGFPQLKTETYPSQLFWLFVCFVTLYIVMSKVALPGVESVLKQRQSHREGELKRASELQEEAAKVKAGFEAALAKAQSEAQDSLNAAAQEISEKAAEENAKFTEASRKRVATAEQNIAKAREEALASLADISADVAAEMVGKVAGVTIGKADARVAVAKILKEAA